MAKLKKEKPVDPRKHGRPDPEDPIWVANLRCVIAIKAATPDEAADRFGESMSDAKTIQVFQRLGILKARWEQVGEIQKVGAGGKPAGVVVQSKLLVGSDGKPLRAS